jgi:hypothetical protein
MLVRSCPYCGSLEVRRSRRRGPLERLLLPLLLLHPFRCMDCYRRHYSVFFARRSRRQVLYQGISTPDPRHDGDGRVPLRR